MQAENAHFSKIVWYQSLRGKILQLLLLLLVLFAIVIFIAIKMQVQRESYLQAETLITEQATNIVAELGQKVSYIEAVATSMANVSAAIPNDKSTINRVVGSLLRQHQSEASIIGAGLWPEPFALDPSEERLSYAWGKEQINQADTVAEENPPVNDYHRAAWYVVATSLKPGQTYWSQAYTDPVSGDTIVTCSAPYFSDGQLQGVISLDVKFAELSKILSYKSLQFPGYAMALDRHGRFLSYPLPDHVTQEEPGQQLEYMSAQQFSLQDNSFIATYRQLEKSLAQRRQSVRNIPELFKAAIALSQRSDQITLDAAILIVEYYHRLPSYSRVMFQQNETSLSLFAEPAAIMAFEMPRTQWTILVTVPQHFFSSLFDQLTINLVWLMSLLLILCAVVGWLLLNKIILTPLTQLQVQLQAQLNAKSEGLMTEHQYIEFRPLARMLYEQISVRAAAQVSVESKGESKQSIMANLSNDIRIPMNSMLGTAELLRGSLPDDRTKDYVSLIKKSANSMLTVLNDVLDYLKIEAGQLELEQSRFDLLEVVDHVYTSLRPSVNSKLRMRFSLNYPNNVHRFFIGDPVRLQQVLSNLVANALQFTDRGFVELSVCSTGCQDKLENLVFTVADSGIGIPATKLSQLFDRVNYPDEVNRSGLQGSGLGLVICSRLINLMGGSLTVESQLGEGSVFTIALGLPRARQSRPQHIIGGGYLALDKLVGLKVLLVEDNKLNQIVIKQMLSLLQLQVFIASNGLECLLFTQQHQFDVIYMDMHMSDMDGISATKMLRSGDTVNSKTPIIALMEGTLEADANYFEQAGMQGYISKPISRQAFIDETVRVLGLQLSLEEVVLPINKNSQ